MDTELIRPVVHALDEAGIAHMVTGSLASAYHGEPRATRDIDVVIDPDGGSIEVLVEAFPSDRFYAGDAAGAVDRRDMFNIVDTRSGWKVDLIVRRSRAFSTTELEWQPVSRSDTQRAQLDGTAESGPGRRPTPGDPRHLRRYRADSARCC